MERNEQVMKNLNLSGCGLEIGPSYNPVLPKKNGYDVKVLDYTTREGLIDHYRDDPNVKDLLDNIEEVDYVWNGERYPELTGEGRFDYVIGCHIIEHQTDLIHFLEDCSRILKDDGILSLAVPDSRYEFDFFREPSSIRTVLDTHMLGLKVHSPGTLIEYSFSDVTLAGNGTHIPAYFPGSGVKTIVPKKYGLREWDEWDPEKYTDTHSWVFTPASFRLLIYELRVMGFTDLAISSLTVPGQPSLEFYVQLRKKPGEQGSRKVNEVYLRKLQIARKREEYERLKCFDTSARLRHLVRQAARRMLGKG